MDEINILNNQLSRMRSMNKYYHDQFLFDVRILFFFTIIFHYLAFSNNTAYMLIQFLSLFGSVLLAFHAHLDPHYLKLMVVLHFQKLCILEAGYSFEI